MSSNEFYSEFLAKEVIPGLMLGGISDLDFMLNWKPDVLVPLDHLPASVWASGFRGEILYYPIGDLDILPGDVLDRLVTDVVDRLHSGKRVAMFCIGGHGRTGYAAACVLFRYGAADDPVGFLRDHYSPAAVETYQQAQAVARFISDTLGNSRMDKDAIVRVWFGAARDAANKAIGMLDDPPAPNTPARAKTDILFRHFLRKGLELCVVQGEGVVRGEAAGICDDIYSELIEDAMAGIWSEEETMDIVSFLELCSESSSGIPVFTELLRRAANTDVSEYQVSSMISAADHELERFMAERKALRDC